VSALVLHIGTHKTGTTALQQTLLANCDALAARGFDYPRLGRDAGHHLLVTRWIDLPRRHDDGRPALAHWRRLAARHAGGDRTLVLSSEGFSRARPQTVDFGELAGLAAGFGRRTVVCYLRNQAAFIQSVYVEVLKRGRLVDFDGFVAGCIAEAYAGGLFLDYGALFAQVRAGFAPDEIRFFAYEEAVRHPGGLVGHFLATIGAPPCPPLTANVSPGPVALWAALRRAAPRRPSPAGIAAAERALRTLYGDARPTLFTRAQLAALRARFEPLNRAAEAAVADPGFRLAPLAVSGPVVHRDELDLERLLAAAAPARRDPDPRWPPSLTAGRGSCERDHSLPAEPRMRGCVDHLTPNNISGWVFDPAVGSGKMQVRVTLSDQVLIEGFADRSRPDVGKLLGTGGDHGFRFSDLDFSLADAGRVVIEARPAADAPWRAVRRGRHIAPRVGNAAAGKAVAGNGAGRAAAGAARLARGLGAMRVNGVRRGQYQSFDDAKGGSKSAEKLTALRLQLLPNAHSEAMPLQGLSVLDLGCNEGFFCGEALRQGARRVVGIDQSKNFLERAKVRFPEARFIRGSWWDLPNEKFDVILFLSAIHYEPKQRALLEKLAQHLTPTGVLVLECGVVQGQGKTWQAVKRADDIRRYPTFPMLLRELLKPYAGRLMGASVMQGGDPVPRYVFHCPLRRSMALIVAGSGRSGKSTLAFDLEERNIPLVRTDRLLGGLLNDKRYGFSPVAEVVQALPRTSPPHYGVLGTSVAAQCPKEFVDVLMREAPLEADLFCIEGEILRHAAVSRELVRRLRAQGILPWLVSPTP
jgi:hypothetical protein